MFLNTTTKGPLNKGPFREKRSTNRGHVPFSAGGGTKFKLMYSLCVVSYVRSIARLTSLYRLTGPLNFFRIFFVEV